MLLSRLVFLITIVSSFLSICSTPVFGDGLFEETLSATLGDRVANLVIKMTPPVITTETLTNTNQKPVIEFRLFDSITNSSFSPHQSPPSILDPFPSSPGTSNDNLGIWISKILAILLPAAAITVLVITIKRKPKG